MVDNGNQVIAITLKDGSLMILNNPPINSGDQVLNLSTKFGNVAVSSDTINVGDQVVVLNTNDGLVAIKPGSGGCPTDPVPSGVLKNRFNTNPGYFAWLPHGWNTIFEYNSPQSDGLNLFEVQLSASLGYLGDTYGTPTMTRFTINNGNNPLTMDSDFGGYWWVGPSNLPVSEIQNAINTRKNEYPNCRQFTMPKHDSLGTEQIIAPGAATVNFMNYMEGITSVKVEVYNTLDDSVSSQIGYYAYGEAANSDYLDSYCRYNYGVTKW